MVCVNQTGLQCVNQMGERQSIHVAERHGNGMVCVNQTGLHCVNQMGETQSKHLAERHGMCESAFRVTPNSVGNTVT
jgi:hypothetical protein